MPLHPLRKRRSRTLRSLDPAAFLPQPPGPPVARVTAVDRVAVDVVRFTLDTAVSDLGACGDLRVNGNGPSAATLVDPFTVDATYAGLPAGPGVWNTESVD